VLKMSDIRHKGTENTEKKRSRITRELTFDLSPHFHPTSESFSIHFFLFSVFSVPLWLQFIPPLSGVIP